MWIAGVEIGNDDLCVLGADVWKSAAGTRRIDIVILIGAMGGEDYRRSGRRTKLPRGAFRGDHAVLDEVGETLQSVWERRAFELWGVSSAKLTPLPAAGGLGCVQQSGVRVGPDREGRRVVAG
jgi:hypothetical protein